MARNDTQPTSGPPHPDSFRSRSTLAVGDRSFEIFRLDAEPLAGHDVGRLPYSVKVLLENLLRHEDGVRVSAADVAAVADWGRRPEAHGSNAGDDAKEIAFSPERVLMQDLTGVPGVVDLAAMRDALAAMGGDPSRINPLVPVELVIDHSVIAERSGHPGSFGENVRIEYERNLERYQLLRWAQGSFDGFRVVPPGTGICHQVNLEYLSRVVFATPDGRAYCDTLVGLDSHTTMVNGLGVLGWGVGGIEAEAAMLGQPISMLLPPVVGLRLVGELAEGTTATDLVLTITELLRRHGVVGKFVEAFGPGRGCVAAGDPGHHRQHGARVRGHLHDLPDRRGHRRLPAFHRARRRPPRPGRGLRQGAGAVARAGRGRAGLLRDGGARPFHASSRAWPGRPAPRTGSRWPVPVAAFRDALGREPRSAPEPGEGDHRLTDGDVVIAAITSCTNTSNPQVLVAAGLLAKRAVERGLSSKPWVKTSLAPGSRVVMDYLGRAGLTGPLEQLGFYLVGFGCTTCIGNSGPLLPGDSEAVVEHELSVVSVLSGNRNFEGRIHPDVRMNYLASPPLVVAYALAGTMDIDLTTDPIGTDNEGRPVHLADLWPSDREVAEVIRASLTSDEFRTRYASVFEGDELWREVPVAEGETFAWDTDSTYVLQPPYFEGMAAEPGPVTDIDGARVLAVLGDSVTTDHISPAGSIRATSPAGEYLTAHGVAREDFNSYGTRRGNHEVMVRGTFANVRLRNQLAPGTEGGFTLHLPDGEGTTIFDAAMQYQRDGVPLLVLAGKEYGTGSSRDWAAKGTRLLGVRAVLAESYERIHRSNLVGMGVVPLQYLPGQSAASLGLTGHETYAISGLVALNDGAIPKEVAVRATADDGTVVEFSARVRIDTPMEAEYYRHGGILPYVLRRLAG